MQSTTSTSNNKSPPNTDFLVDAGKAVEKVITLEENYLDLADVLTGATSDSYIKPLLNSNEDFVEINNVPVPQSILTQMEGIQCRSFTGLLPEIGRAWITIDHRLFIWSYTNPKEIFEYKEQDQIISGAGIIKPKPGIFEEKINYIFVFATPLQVIVLGLSVMPNELKVYATDINVPADDVQMRSISGTEDGRVFMVGNDANVYELVYNNPERFFGGKSYLECKTLSPYMKYLPRFAIKNNTTHTKSIAIDNERKVLYLLSNSSIEAIYLGDKSNNYKFIAKNTTIVETAIQMCRQHSRMYNADAFELESLHIISEAESKRIHLMAITSAGFRLYFSLYRDGFRNTMMNMSSQSNIPNALEFGHIRIPPIQESIPQSNALVRGTYYDCGICLSIKTKNDEIDSIVVTSAVPNTVITPPQTTYPLFTQMSSRPVYLESVDTVDTKSKAYSLAETRPELKGKRAIKELSQQLSQPPRQFMILTTRGVVFYNKLRPVDVLFKIITKQGRLIADEQKEYQAFFERYGSTESCAMCLSIICNTDAQDIVNKATNIFFDYGGVPTSANSFQSPGNHLGQVVGQTGVNFSGKHDGFLLYFARMVAPIWKLKVFANCGTQDQNSAVLFAKTQSLLYEARCNLESLKQFMNQNPRFHDCANISDPRFQAADRTKLELDLAEQKSVRELYLLLSQCSDVVYFIEFLLDSNLQSILASSGLQEDRIRVLLDLDVDTMLTTTSGRELARDLVIGTIGKYGSNNSHTNFDIVSNQLRRQCNTYFTENDILFFKGIEYLKRVLSTEADYEQRVSIKESLEYFKKSAGTINSRMMEAICTVYINYSFHVGVVELALERAQKVDPQNIALLVLDSPKDSDEVRNGLLQLREESYGFALKALDDAYQHKFQPIPTDHTPISDANVHFRMVIDKALESNDQLFHYRLYEWFMNNNLREELMKIDTPYLIKYFKHHVGDEKSSLEFLWEYYRNRSNFAEAAKCLYHLAFTKSSLIHLNERLRYLTLARVNIQSVPQDQPSRELVEFNARVEQDIRIASFQSRIYYILRSIQGVETQVAADKLQSELFDEKELWEQFGSQFQVLTSLFLEQMT